MAGLRSVPAPFLMKTYQLVDDKSTDDVVSWNENGTAFVVWKTAEFANDILPNYFKHNNFSSFVRQLNTYGFHKIVPHKWEFGNEFFRRGQKDLLLEIQRRKIISGKPTTANSPPSPSGSSGGDELRSSSTSANTAADLSDENEKLKRANERLSLELAAARKRQNELVAFLSEELKVNPDQIDRMVERTTRGEEEFEDDCGRGMKDEGVGESLKLFGVWLKGEKKKRGRDENFGGVKGVGFQAPLLKSSRVCN